MNQKITTLLSQLDNNTSLFRLPCYCDDISKIQFRIGPNGGPHIKLYSINEEMYNLDIVNSKGVSYSHPVNKNEDVFEKCQNVYQKIRALINNNEYQKNLEENIGLLNTNLVNSVDYII